MFSFSQAMDDGTERKYETGKEFKDDSAILEAKKELEKWKALVLKEEDKKSLMILEKVDNDESKARAQKEMEALFNETERRKKEISNTLRGIENDISDLEKRNAELRENLRSSLAKVKAGQAESFKLQQKFKIFATIPEKKVKFSGKASEEEIPEVIKGVFTITQRPSVILNGGQALITFEEEKVANQILKMAKCLVTCEKDKIDVKPMSLQLEPSVKFEIHIDVSKKSVRFSDAPPIMAEERMRDRLEMSFSRPSLGGGEVKDVEYDKVTGTGQITFLHTGVAENLALKRKYPVDVEPNTTVNIGPVYSYELKKFQTFCGTPKRTILLEGVEDVEDEEDLQDQLEIHFQKPSNYGGEVESIKYLSAGKKIKAFFGDDTVQLEEA
ncbi:N-myc-interactor isoform X2 [Hypomesus transpacificus]|uniref:N-myc-interactor isoform X2 n=2 Tax=Hypomesus transpacificus TaxID=137520 RepID=UPI001F07EF52|nr:N-myc-interactor isoform X2 [Hypomesus transpacificus]